MRASCIPLLASALALAPASLAQQGPLAEGTRGMVSSAHGIATEAGLEVLEKGGNAFDAAVAVAATLNVVEPMMSGMGGYGTILVYSAKEDRVRFLNASAHIPFGVQPDAYRAPTPNYRANRRGATAVSTPGNVRAWQALSEGYGALEWQQLFTPAIRAAAEGFALSDRHVYLAGAAFEQFDREARELYAPGGERLGSGDRLVQLQLAKTLELLAAGGPGAFHDGPIAAAIDRVMRERGGFLRKEDLQKVRAEWYEPVQIEFGGLQVCTASPPANSFPALVRLGMMAQWEWDEGDHNSADYLHRFGEVTKHAFWTRLRWAGDPDIAPPPLDRLLSQDYWGEQVAAIDENRARPFEPPQQFGERNGDGHTTHFVVADAAGNVVSATQTLGNSFGSRIQVPGTGIWLNNSLAYCTFEPPGNPMDAHPGRRKLSGDAPTIVLRDGRPWIAIGTPGGHTIPQTVPQMLLNLITFGMPIDQAIAAPRVSFVEPDFLAVEPGIPAAVRDELERRGHQLRDRQALGNAHGLTIEWDDDEPVRFTGAADPRGIGSARGR